MTRKLQSALLTKAVINMNILIFIILGLIIGSFLNVIVLRFDDLMTVINTRSHCPHCKKNLNWYDLIPVLSYILLVGKCRYCKANISLQYPLVELGTALIFSLIYWVFGFSLVSYFLLAISSILIVIFVYDIIKYEISDRLVLAAAALWIVYLIINFFLNHNSLFLILNYFYGALALGGFFGLLVLISREKWMGIGDISLGAVVGIIIGWPNVLLAAFLAFFIGSIVGVSLMLINKKKFKDKLPFAPFLILGLWITLLFGQKILSWYFGGFF